MDACLISARAVSCQFLRVSIRGGFVLIPASQLFWIYDEVVQPVWTFRVVAEVHPLNDPDGRNCGYDGVVGPQLTGFR